MGEERGRGGLGTGWSGSASRGVDGCRRATGVVAAAAAAEGAKVEIRVVVEVVGVVVVLQGLERIISLVEAKTMVLVLVAEAGVPVAPVVAPVSV